MPSIVTTHYRYPRPPRMREAAALEMPAVVKAEEPAKAGKRAKTPRWQIPGPRRRPTTTAGQPRKRRTLRHFRPS